MLAGIFSVIATCWRQHLMEAPHEQLFLRTRVLVWLFVRLQLRLQRLRSR